MNRQFKVIEHKKRSGLTVGSFSRKPGYIFTEKEWPGDSESLKAAIENKRCVEIDKDGKERKEKKESNPSKKELAKNLKSAEKKYSELDPESNEAKEILDLINRIKEELE